MSARAIGEIVGGKVAKPPGTRRTFEPVRRNSRHRGEREEKIWRSFGRDKKEQRRFIGAMLQAAERYDRIGKLAGRKNGHLGHVALEALRELFRIANWKTGCLEPAIATICDRIKRSRAAVVSALARLKEHGFLDWIRRTEPTDNVGEVGPQVRQIPNAYGFDIARLPRASAAFVKKAIGWGLPAPDCEEARQAQDRAELDGMLSTLSCEEQARVVGPEGDADLEDRLAALGRALDRSASSPGGQNPGDGE